MTTTVPSLLRLCALVAGLACAAFTAGCHGTAYPVSTTWPLAGTVWKLVELNGDAVAANKLPSLLFDATAGRVSGRSGVNTFTGGYTLQDARLTFAPLAVTKMAGSPNQMKIEAAFLAALAQVDGWKLEGNTLSLLSGGREIARFQGLPAGTPL